MQSQSKGSPGVQLPPNTTELERIVISSLMQNSGLRGVLQGSHPGLFNEPQLLFSAPEAIALIPKIIAEKGKYTSASLARDFPNLKGDWGVGRLYNLAMLNELADDRFEANCDFLYKARWWERGRGLFLNRMQVLSKTAPEQVGAFYAETLDEVSSLAFGTRQMLDIDVDKILDREEVAAKQGKGLRTPTGIRAIDELTGGLLVTPGSGEFIVIGGNEKMRKSTIAANICLALLNQAQLSNAKVVWVNNEPSQTVGDIAIMFMRIWMSKWLRGHKPSAQWHDFSHDEVKALMKEPSTLAFKNETMGAAKDYFRTLNNRLRILGTALDEGDSTDFRNVMGMVRVEVEARGASLVVLDRLQGWMDPQNALEDMLTITKGVGDLVAHYHVPVIAVSEYNQKGTLNYGKKIAYDASIWFECNYEFFEATKKGKLTLSIIRSRWTPTGRRVVEILPNSGLMLGVIGGAT